MGRLKRATAILDDAERWKQRCLLDGESLFTEERLWTRGTLRPTPYLLCRNPADPAGNELRVSQPLLDPF